MPVVDGFGNATMSDERTRCSGRVRWFCPDRGFGFLEPDDAEHVDVFVSWESLPDDGFRTLRPGEAVTFLLTEDGHGPTAAEVARVRVTADVA